MTQEINNRIENDDLPLDAALAGLTAPGMMFEVESRRIAGSDFTMFKHLPNNLGELYRLGDRFSDDTFLTHHDSSLSFSQTMLQVEVIAQSLVLDYDIGKGDRVAIAMPNMPQWCLTFMATTQIGAVCVAMNSWWKRDELQYAIDEVKPKIIVVDACRLEYVRDLSLSDCTIFVVEDVEMPPENCCHFDLLRSGSPKPGFVCPQVEQEDDAVIFYTSGSTSFPKAAISNHRMVLTTLFSWALTAQALEQTEGPLLPPQTQGCCLLCLPLFHVTACYNLFLLSIVSGRKLVFIDRWNVDNAMSLIESEKVTHFVAVPTMAYELLNAPNRSSYDLSSLREIGGGGAARPSSQVEQLNTAFCARISVGYGMTETNGLGCLNGGSRYLDKPASVGRATKPIVSICIVDEFGSQVASGVTGEILIKSASNISRYWHSREEHEELLVDGWLATGDVGYLDSDDYLFIVDRKKSIVIRGGENISTLEVEDKIATHPDVLESAVFGVPDERLGEALVAIVVVRDASELRSEELQEYLADRLAHFKVPETIRRSDVLLPRVATGKIDKRQVRARFLDSNWPPECDQEVG